MAACLAESRGAGRYPARHLVASDARCSVGKMSQKPKEISLAVTPAQTLRTNGTISTDATLLCTAMITNRAIVQFTVSISRFLSNCPDFSRIKRAASLGKDRPVRSRCSRCRRSQSGSGRQSLCSTPPLRTWRCSSSEWCSCPSHPTK